MAIRLPQFPIEGGCVCAGIRYRVTAPPLSVYACHCKDCQRFAGGPYSMAMAVRREDVFVLRGVPKSFSKPADSGRIVGVRFCADCGTRLWHEPVHSPHLLNITAGTLDDMSWLKPAAHVWASRKMPWVEIEPGALSFAEQPQAREPLYAAWEKARGER
jgi:hypothetical protein